MKYTLIQGYNRKMKLYVREKVKIIDDAEIDLNTVDKSGNLLPRKVNKMRMQSGVTGLCMRDMQEKL